MNKMDESLNRRSFIKTTASVATAITGLSTIPLLGLSMDHSLEESIHIIGPKEGFSPQVGTLVSMMNWMRMVVLQSVEKMNKAELDYLHDRKSNTIGAMLFHLAAIERHYQEALEGIGIDQL